MPSSVEIDIDDLTRSCPGESLTQQTQSRSCTLAFLHDGDISSLVGSCLVGDLTETQAQITPQILESALKQAVEKAAKMARMFDQPADNPRRLLLVTRTDKHPYGKTLGQPSLEWLAANNYLLVGTDCSRFADGDEAPVIDYLKQVKLTMLLNLELRGITSNAIYRMAGSALACSSESLVPARVVLMY